MKILPIIYYYYLFIIDYLWWLAHRLLGGAGLMPNINLTFIYLFFLHVEYVIIFNFKWKARDRRDSQVYIFTIYW